MADSRKRKAYDGGAHPSSRGTVSRRRDQARGTRAALPDCARPRNRATCAILGFAVFRDRMTPGSTADTEDVAMTKPLRSAKLRPIRTEAEIANDPDAVAGRALVEARVARCSGDEQAAFWAAVRRCFGGPAPEAAA